MKIERDGFELRTGRPWGRMAILAAGALAVLAGGMLPEALTAEQVTPAATSPQMRHFWHVFAAYAIAWILLFGWLVSIGRRLARVEGRFDS